MTTQIADKNSNQLAINPDGSLNVAVISGGGGGGGGGASRAFLEAKWTAINAGTGYSVGDVIEMYRMMDVSGATPTQVGALYWYNFTTQSAITTPTIADLQFGTGGLTNTQLRASAVPVSMASTPALTDTQLRASAVPVSMASTPGLTDTQLRATPVPISDANLGAQADASATTDTGTFSLISLTKRVLTKLPAAGQAAMAASQPVVVASDQTTMPVRYASSAAALAAGVTAYATPNGRLRVNNEGTSRFFDAFDSLDTTNIWVANSSTGTATVATGVLTVASSTTASAWGGLKSATSFVNKGLAFLESSFMLNIPNSTIANSARWWGRAVVQTTPTPAAPVVDGVGFLLDGTGALFGKVYAGGSEVGSVTLTSSKPTDNTYNHYRIEERSDTVMFYIGNTDVPAGTINGLAPNVHSTLLNLLSIAGSTPPGSSATMLFTQIAVTDTGKNNFTVSDYIYPWRTAVVTKNIPAGSEYALAVMLHPTSPLNGHTVHSAASAGAPVRVAGRVNTAVDTTLVAGDTSDLFMSTAGQLITKEYATAELDWQATSGLTPLASTTLTAMKAAAGAGIRNYLTAIQLVNTSITVATTVTILDGSTVLWAGNLPLATSTSQDDIRISFPTPLRGTANTALNIQLGTTLASVYWNAQGFAAP